jgi:hypothetical protein
MEGRAIPEIVAKRGGGMTKGRGEGEREVVWDDLFFGFGFVLVCLYLQLWLQLFFPSKLMKDQMIIFCRRPGNR